MRKWNDLSEDKQRDFERYFEDDIRSPLSDFVRVRHLKQILGPELFKDFLLTYDLDCTKLGTYLGEFDLGGEKKIVSVIYALYYSENEEDEEGNDASMVG